MTTRTKAILRLCQRTFLAVGLSTLGYCAVMSSVTVLFQHQARERLSQPRGALTPGIPGWPSLRPLRAGRGFDLLGRIDIPRINLSAMVAEGATSRVLRVSVGHMPGTALPSQFGNVGLVAHRDSFFRRLGELEPGDMIRFTVPGNEYTYRVTFTDIVDPRETWVLQPSTGENLTLVTCYPFHFVGPAPKRFVVRARQDSRQE